MDNVQKTCITMWLRLPHGLKCDFYCRLALSYKSAKTLSHFTQTNTQIFRNILLIPRNNFSVVLYKDLICENLLFLLSLGRQLIARLMRHVSLFANVAETF